MIKTNIKQAFPQPIETTTNPFEKKLLTINCFLGDSRVHKQAMASVLNSHPQSNFQILHPEKSLIALYRALLFLKMLHTKNKSSSQKKALSVLFVNTNPAFANLIQRSATRCKQHFINTKWVGGTLTNWKQVSKSIKGFHVFQQKWMSLLPRANYNFPRFKKMKKCFSGYCDKTSSHLNLSQVKLNDRPQANSLKVDKPQIHPILNKTLKTTKPTLPIPRDLLSNMIQTSFGGSTVSVRQTLQTYSNFRKSQKSQIQTQKKILNSKFSLQKPDVIIIMDPYYQQTAIEEARSQNIPVIAFVNSDTPRVGITYPIPGNNQSHHYIHYCLNFMVKILST